MDFNALTDKLYGAENDMTSEQMARMARITQKYSQEIQRWEAFLGCDSILTAQKSEKQNAEPVSGSSILYGWIELAVVFPALRRVNGYVAGGKPVTDWQSRQS